MNLAAVLGAAGLILRLWRVGNRWGLVALLLPGLVLGEALMIIPEQRFMMVFHVALWWALLAFVMMSCAQFRWRGGSLRPE
jgi:uncharacterized membrane protein